VSLTRALGWSLALLLCAGFGALGHWQQQRGADKAVLLAAWQAAMTAPALPVLPWTRSEQIRLPAAVEGELGALPMGRWLLQDNARRGAAVGLKAYFVADLGSGRGLLIDAGWLPFDRARGLPALPPLPTRFRAEGLLVPWPGQGIKLAEPRWPAPGTPALLLRIEREAIAADAGVALIDGVLRLSPAAEFGFARDLDALPNTLPPEKHYGYALQWWGLAAASLVVAVVLTLRSRSR
jgi:cytochrome oxidase assembly protein ShyY1